MANRFLTRDDGEPTAARLLQIPGDHVGRAKKRSVIYLGRAGMYAVSLSPLLFLFAIAGVAYLLHLLFEMFGVPNEVLAAIFAVAAIPFLILVRRWNNSDNDVAWRFLVWYYRRAVTLEALARDDVLFPPDSPDVMYAEMTPRRAWVEVQAHRNECEAGLLFLDTDRRSVLFEGDRYRYVIPFDSILRYTVEEVAAPNFQNGTTAGFFAVVFVVRTADGDRELPLSPLDGIDGRNRWEKTTSLYDRIAPLVEVPVDLSLAGSPPAGRDL
jgi:hypothetical protein